MGWGTVLASGGNILTTELDSLANDARSAVGEFNNTTGKAQYGLLKFTTPGFAIAPSVTSPALKINMISSADGTAWADGSDTIDPGADTYRGTIPIRPTTNAQKKEFHPVMLLPGKNGFLITNKTGQALPASGNVIEIFTWEA